MAFQLPELPFALDALEPHMSRRTLALHHGKHHKSYVDKLNAATDGTPWSDRELREVVFETSDRNDAVEIFNNAAQVWNHSFFWHCLSPEGGGEPDGDLAERIDRDFGGLGAFRARFRELAVDHFGSGWLWLVADENGLDLVAMDNAGTPVAEGHQPLLTIDLWEHAYYLDYQNERESYIDAFLDHLVSWEFAARNLEDAGGGYWKADLYRGIRETFAASGLGGGNR